MELSLERGKKGKIDSSSFITFRFFIFFSKLEVLRILNKLFEKKMEYLKDTWRSNLDNIDQWDVKVNISSF